MALWFSKKTKGQQPKGKIVSALFTLSGTFPHIFTLFQSFSEFVLRDLFLELRGFTNVLVQKDEKRPKENKNKRKTKPFCTLVVARLSSSDGLQAKT